MFLLVFAVQQVGMQVGEEGFLGPLSAQRQSPRVLHAADWAATSSAGAAAITCRTKASASLNFFSPTRLSALASRASRWPTDRSEARRSADRARIRPRHAGLAWRAPWLAAPGAVGGLGQLCQCGDGGLGTREIARVDLQPRQVLSSRNDMPAARISLHTNRSSRSFASLAPDGFDKHRSASTEASRKRAVCMTYGLSAASAAAFLKSSAASASWPADFAGLGEQQRRRLAIVSYRSDLVGRHGRGAGAQRHDNLAGRLGLHLPAHAPADRLLDRRARNQHHLVGQQPADRNISSHGCAETPSQSAVRIRVVLRAH